VPILSEIGFQLKRITGPCSRNEIHFYPYTLRWPLVPVRILVLPFSRPFYVPILWSSSHPYLEVSRNYFRKRDVAPLFSLPPSYWLPVVVPFFSILIVEPIPVGFRSQTGRFRSMPGSLPRLTLFFCHLPRPVKSNPTVRFTFPLVFACALFPSSSLEYRRYVFFPGRYMNLLRPHSSLLGGPFLRSYRPSASLKIGRKMSE